MTGNTAAAPPPEPLIGMSQDEFRALTAAANGGDQDALAKLKAVLDDSPSIWSKLGDVSQHSEAALLDLASGGNQAVRESIRRQLDSLRAELGHEAADLLTRMGIDRVVLSWLQLHLAERNLANAAPGSPLATFWLRWQNQASTIHSNAMRSLKTVQRCIPGSAATPRLKVVG